MRIINDYSGWDVCLPGKNPSSGGSPIGIPSPVHWRRKRARESCSIRAPQPPLLSSIPRRKTMTKPDLRLLTQWLDPIIVMMLEDRRRLNNEWHRRCKLATLETLWLMLAVSLDTHRSGLSEILRLATAELGIRWSFSVAAFCRARARFSPRRPLMVAWNASIETA